MNIKAKVVIQDMCVYSIQRQVQYGEDWTQVLNDLVQELYVKYGTWAQIELILNNRVAA